MAVVTTPFSVRQSKRKKGCFSAAELGERILTKKATIGVIGQGYVGFPLAQQAAKAGFKTIGYDINGDTILRCQDGNRSGNYRISLSPLALRDCDVLIVAVPTPTRRTEEGWQPDLSYVVTSVNTIATHLLDDDRAQLVVLESTYAPGTTRSVVAPILAAEHDLGRTVLLGYSPERIDPGNSKFSLKNTPKVTSGYDATSARLVEAFYGQILDHAVPASSMEAAEATKILENTFRFVNITFAQEFDTYCEKVGISADEVTNLATTKPFGFMPFFAGAGIGGHCIAEDPYFLFQSMQELGIAAEILAAAVRNHEARGRVVVGRIAHALGARPLAGSRLLLLGVSYKPAIGDARRSPAGPILELLAQEGAKVDYHDTFVPRYAGMKSVELSSARPEDYDLAVVITKHPDVDCDRLATQGWRVFDPRISRRSMADLASRSASRHATSQPEGVLSSEVRA